ncbi:hypothetical protein P7C70_g9284, partial [Phenoliferia sp. Uapishka_3]
MKAEVVCDAEDADLADISVSSTHSMKSVLGIRGAPSVTGETTSTVVGGDQDGTQDWFNHFAHGFDVLAVGRRVPVAKKPQPLVSAPGSNRADLSPSKYSKHPDFFELSPKAGLRASGERRPFTPLRHATGGLSGGPMHQGNDDVLESAAEVAAVASSLFEFEVEPLDERAGSFFAGESSCSRSLRSYFD